MARVLVTGGSGFIGLHLIRRLRRRECEVFNVDIRNSENPIDVTDFAQLCAVFQKFKPDIVVHLASLASVPLCEAKPLLALRTNVDGTFNVVRCAIRSDAKVIFASSAAVYGNPINVPSSEGSQLNPVNCYGVTKLRGEHIVQLMMPSSFVILRIFNCYGPQCERSYVIPDIVRKLMSDNGRIQMQGTGEEARDLVYIEDVLDAFVSATRSDVVGVFNVGTGRATKIRDLAKMIAEIMGKNDVEFVFQKRMRRGDYLVNQADISKLIKELEVCPKVSLKEGLFLTINGHSYVPTKNLDS